MFNRIINPTLKQTVEEFPVTVLTGPRQSGKTTVLKTLFPEFEYINLEAPDIRSRVQADPRDFFARRRPGWIIDEAQQYPELFSYVHDFIETQKHNTKWILSGSQNFLLSANISQSLAGRAAILELLPLTYSEYTTYPNITAQNLWSYLYHGSYPRPYHEKMSINRWYNSYIMTYIERDVRSLIQIKNLNQFQIFLQLCAGRHGQILNLNAIAQATGISQPAARQWLSILEASYLVYLLRPYHQNFNKRIIKSPKLYFYDSAIVCQLLGIDSPEHLQFHASRGAIFEGFILSEIIKQSLAMGRPPRLYFWRDQTGHEIDGVIEKGPDNLGVEIKSTATFHPSLLKRLNDWAKISGTSTQNLYLVYAGDEAFTIKGINIIPWKQAVQLGA
ncbi:MAG: ATP-binding protein [Pseudomonadota bacterium]